MSEPELEALALSLPWVWRGGGGAEGAALLKDSWLGPGWLELEETPMLSSWGSCFSPLGSLRLESLPRSLLRSLLRLELLCLSLLSFRSLLPLCPFLCLRCL